jgi:hypothetical protein
MQIPQMMSTAAETPKRRQTQWAQAAVLAALLSAPALLSLRAGVVTDPDVWWQMRTGEWIMEHHALPHADPFSSFAAGQSWAAYSWLFDLLIAHLFGRFGLLGMVLYTTGMVVAIVFALNRLVRSSLDDFPLSVLLTAWAAACISGLWMPRPWMFSILFFTLEVHILFEARKTGRCRTLLWLPLIFALWANLHIQFIDGLMILALAFVESALAPRWSALRTRIPIPWIACISGACLVAPLLNPYGWHVYEVAYDLATQSGRIEGITELNALGFRNYSDWGVLLLTFAVIAVLAKTGKTTPFEIALLAFSIYVSFHSQRDAWIVVIVASAILAQTITVSGNDRSHVTPFMATAAAAISLLVAAVGIRLTHLDGARLQMELESRLPARAVAEVKERNLEGPLFNDYTWGGYLIWSLRIPVSIDGRAGLQGDQHINRSAATWSGERSWASDPDLAKANLVIGPVWAPLTQLLRTDRDYELVYEDRLAAVFIARKN